MALDFPATPSAGDVYKFGGKKWRYDGSLWLRLEEGLVNAAGSSFRMSPDATPSYNSGAIADAISCAAGLNTGIYIPGEYPYELQDPITMIDSEVVPIYGDGKYKTYLISNSLTDAIIIKPPTDGSNNEGHVLHGFSIWPKVAATSDTGIRVQLRSAEYCYYGHWDWHDIAVGDFHTKSINLDNSVMNTNGIFDGVISGNSKFYNSASFIWVGDSMVCREARFTGHEIFEWYSILGARCITIEDCILLSDAGVLIQGVCTLNFLRNQVEISVNNYYDPYALDALVTIYGHDSTHSSSAIIMEGNAFGAYGPVRPSAALSFANYVDNVEFNCNSLLKGTAAHIGADSLTYNINGVGNIYYDSGGRTTGVVSLAGANSSINT